MNNSKEEKMYCRFEYMYRDDANFKKYDTILLEVDVLLSEDDLQKYFDECFEDGFEPDYLGIGVIGVDFLHEFCGVEYISDRVNEHDIYIGAGASKKVSEVMAKAHEGNKIGWEHIFYRWRARNFVNSNLVFAEEFDYIIDKVFDTIAIDLVDYFFDGTMDTYGLKNDLDGLIRFLVFVLFHSASKEAESKLASVARVFFSVYLERYMARWQVDEDRYAVGLDKYKDKLREFINVRGRSG